MQFFRAPISKPVKPRGPQVSLRLIGLLGGATKQAVHNSGNPIKWLQSRLRRQMVVDEFSWSRRVGAIPSRAQKTLRPILSRVRDSLQTLPEPLKKGRPRKEKPQDLAEYLGVPWKEGDSILKVFSKYIKSLYFDLKEVYRGIQKGIPWYKMRRALDRWLPRWVNKDTGYAPSSWAYALECSKEYLY